MDGTLRSSSQGRTTLEICAPELLQEGSYHDERLDIWGFGCVAYFVAIGNYPFASFRTELDFLKRFSDLKQEAVPTIVEDSKLMVKSEETEHLGLDHFLSPLVQCSLMLDFEKRPSATQLLALLESLKWPFKFDKVAPCSPQVSDYIDRCQRLRELNDHLKLKSQILMHGLPGVGKTMLAAQYIVEYQQQYERILYLPFPIQHSETNDMLMSLLNMKSRNVQIRPQLIKPWLQFFARGLIVLEVGDELSTKAIQLLKALVLLIREFKCIQLMVVARTQGRHYHTFLKNLPEFRLGDFTVDEATRLGQKVQGLNCSRRSDFSGILEFGLSRPLVLHRILRSIFSVPQVVDATKRLMQHTMSGRRIECSELNLALASRFTLDSLKLLETLDQSQPFKMFSLGYLNPSLINRRLAEWLWGYWCQTSRMPVSSLGLDALAEIGVIQWTTPEHKSFHLDPYLSAAAFYKYARRDSHLGLELWRATRAALERFAGVIDPEWHVIEVVPHLKRLLEAGRGVTHSGMSLVGENEFPNLWSIYRESCRFKLKLGRDLLVS